MTPISHRAFLIALTAVFVGALALRIGVTSSFVGLGAPPDYDANPDQIDYEFYASQMAAGKGYTEKSGQPGARRPPGTSWAILPAYLAFGRSFAAARVWFCVMSAATCVLVGVLTRQCFGAVAGVIAAVWLALYPGHFYYTMHFLSETPYGLWLSAALVLTITGIKNRSKTAHIAAGACWGLAILTRPQLIFLLPVSLVAAWFATATTRRERLFTWGLQACLVMLVLLPWVGRNAVALGKPTISTIGGHGLWGANNEVVLNTPHLAGSWVKTSTLRNEQHPLFGSEIEMEATAWRYGFEFIQQNATQMPYLCVMKLFRLVWPMTDTPNTAVRWAFALGWIAVAPFLIAGLYLGWRQARGPALVLLIPMASIVVMAIVFYGSGRFRDSCAPAFLPFASLAVAKLLGAVFPALAATPTTPAATRQPTVQAA